MIILADSDRRKVVNPVRELAGTILDNRPLKSPRLKLWPSGDVAVWFVEEYEEADKHWRIPGGVSPEVAARTAQAPPAPKFIDGLEVSQAESERSDSDRKQRGLDGLTSYGAKMVKSAVALLAEKYGTHKLTFCTITVPPLAIQEAAELWRQWPEFLRQLVQFLGRELQKAGQPASLVSVTEIQTERGKKRGEPYLHLHLVWGNRRVGRGRFAVNVDRLRAWVHSFFERVVGRDIRVPRIETELVRKDARAYIAKYCSKGPEAISMFTEVFGEGCVPSTWWNLSGNLRKAVKAAIVVSRAGGEFINDVIPLVRAEGRISGDGITLSAIWLGEPKESPVLGYAGRVWGQFERDLREVCAASYEGRLAGL